MGSTGITVDPITSVINASESWWKDREVCKIVHAFRRKPPQGWEIMERCFQLYNVQSQAQYSVNQRREEMMNEGTTNNEDQLYRETYDGEMSDSQDAEIQENEEVYRVNITDETRPSNEFIQAHRRHSSVTVDPIQIPSSRVQQRGQGRRGSMLQRSARNYGVVHGSGSRGSKKKQSFETTLTDTMTRFREFQRQSLQQLRPNSFDQDDYDGFDEAAKILESMELPSDTKFYWACVDELGGDPFYRKYFIDRAEKPFEEKINFLQALTGYTRYDEFVGKRLTSRRNFGSPSASGFHSGSPSSGGNNSWGQTSNVQWGQQPRPQQWGTPPSAQQWGTPPNAQQWGQQPRPQQWGTPPSVQQWETQPNSHQWGTSPNVSQWGAYQNTQQLNSPTQWGSSSNDQQWGSSSNISQWPPQTNVQHGFSLETQTETQTETTTPRPIPRTRKSGGLFNIWGTHQGPNLNETHQNDSDDEA
ncbi:PREDICTED: heat shock protein DDB_G0288861-like [Camelina sativa]|uniref:Heat shock protein DDB_G0288861-like n=1 Tax=Camelina sativa TaxID=90675 RepID=A0ABM1QSU1_CAMSA|nr:PREDICTED: heat shock protein DDB_G0288861-like [Camelina sativa]XP_019089829.1 PREDICTED: heat shock protein DDB_G0288861-like [Camelina sativa]